jgi:hypothetical protein
VPELSAHIETIKVRGVSSYKIEANNQYRPLIEAINNAAVQSDVIALAEHKKAKKEAKKKSKKKNSNPPPLSEQSEKPLVGENL